MTDFIKLSEEGWSDPKLLSVGPEGFTLYVKGLMYSKQHLLDGFVPWSALPLIGIGIKSPEKTAKLLASTAADLWEAVEGGYRVKPERWAKWQTTKADVEAVREGWRERKERERVKKAEEKAKRDAEKARDKGASHDDVTRDMGSDSRVNHGEVTPQEKEKEKEKELLLTAIGARPAGSPGNGIDGQWVLIGPSYQVPVAWEAMARLESWRKSGTKLPVSPSAAEIESLGAVLVANKVTPEEFAEFVDFCIGKRWGGLPKERVPRWLGERSSGTCNPVNNPVSGEESEEARKARVAAQIAGIRKEAEERGLGVRS